MYKILLTITFLISLALIFLLSGIYYAESQELFFFSDAENESLLHEKIITKTSKRRNANF